MFFSGVLLAHLYERWIDSRKMLRIAFLYVFTVSLIAVVFRHNAFLVYGDELYLVVLMVAGIIIVEQRLKSVLSNKVIDHMGGIAFYLYLFQMPIFCAASMLHAKLGISGKPLLCITIVCISIVSEGFSISEKRFFIYEMKGERT